MSKLFLAYTARFKLIARATRNRRHFSLGYRYNNIMAEENCTFCKIIRDENRKTEFLYEDDEFVVFLDHKPASVHHYLVCPKQHIHSPKVLTKDDIGLVERLMNVGMEVLQKRDGNTSDVRMGFHWPPFVAVNHLHLHVISPVDRMTWISRGIFMEDSYWFVSVRWLMDRLTSMPDPSESE